MKTNTRRVWAFLPIICLLSISSLSSAQVVVRESVGTIGGSHLISGHFIQSAVGQVYATSPRHQVRPGFLQPLSVAVAPSSLVLDLEVFPNPAANYVTISGSNELASARVMVRDLYGKLIFDQQDIQGSSLRVDCSDWAVGTYFITVYDRQNKAHSSKLIKSN